ncbi:MAG TPA: nuclear transport factor 2 family protein, partial [Mucilaginibacter sp.]
TEMINYLKTLPLPPEGVKSPIIRAIQEGDFVVTHLDIQFMGKRMAVIDLFKLKDGMLTEHWDAIQPLPDESGKAITSTNGTTAIDHNALAENSKHIVSLYYEAVINKASSQQFIHPDYVEHDSVIAESGKTLADHIVERPDVKLHKVIAEGDFVVAQSQFNKSGKGFVLYEIFRVANDKIAEHWAVEQAAPDGVQPEDMF